MANLVRSAKSANDWTSIDLAAYHITVHRQSAETFFGYIPNTIPNAVDPAFLTATVPPNENLSDDTYRLLQYLDLATHTHHGQESAIHDFSKELLHLLGFEERRGTLLRSRHSIPFMICGDVSRAARTDLSLVQGTSTILLIIQEDKIQISNKSPEAQAIAGAIAAFQYNNSTRDRNGLDPLDSMTIPAIAIFGTCPVFYKVPVTQQLSEAVAMGQYPVSETKVVKCVVAPRSRRLFEGMEVPEFRREVLECYEAFRRISKECWETFIV
ncbi:hypothetical protein EV421DRAFT_2008511 [Armillaria borealis]|uniref:Uncharacterized protein n=1 Tax=Armillaria borealis TaxID=47425 RepID=A0AA39JUN6_9AGAR|nr:hypothetical protein EV421DRAFT_2008511 [Armillaria borealis]